MQIKLLLLFLTCLAALSLVAADVKPRIFGGTLATTGQFPFICSLTIEYNDTSFRCGANIILDGFYLLTAAHCIEEKPFLGLPTKVSCIGGVTNLDSNSPSKQVRYSLKTIIHEDYDATLIRNDVAIIQLSEPFRLSATVKDILPELTNPAEGTDLYAAGWGYLEDFSLPLDLYWTIVQYLNPDVCIADLSIFDPATQICAGTTTGNDTCGGDSGGPLYTSTDPYSPQNAKLFGLTSYGIGCALVPGAGYSSVPSLAYGWIKSVLTDCDCYENCYEMKAACFSKYGKYKCSTCSKDFERCKKMCDHRNYYTF